MSEIKKLIERLCPDGVEYKKLGEVCVMQRGTSMTKKNAVEGDIPVISGGKEPAFYINKSNREGETITVAGSGAGAGYVQYWNKPIFVNDAFSVKGSEELLTKYVYYCMKNMQEQITGTQKGGGVPHVHISSIDNFEIPVPPIEVQSKIVEYLDNFTELEAELEIKLEAELEARRKQYEYYRNQLLTFDKDKGARFDVKWMKMSEVGTFTRGKRFVRTDIVEDGVPCIHYGDMYTYYGLKAYKAKTHLTPEKAQKMRFAKKNDVVIVGAGENKNDIGVGVAWLGEEDVAVHDACYIFSSDLYPQYVSHFLRTESYHKQIYPLVSEGKICSISAQSIGRAIIPIPPLEEQQRIVSILDRFETLTTDLQSGLPAEIEARRKQYEYYREKLLTFKRYGKLQ
ncbi:restriction endonuclease subunit S [Prevotella sp. E13-27]|uniref:restriction endonuclease subunit S n=1 Tax=Prevotella sp. E13-27 TaxID=2938122 RepID=UPI00200B59DF|nr:restriction endonuclease subunit S [Prevotella sp. E13-27]MCK8622731.1 restriction endonuclease subunit S [Prevotella sp. E13-27]